MSDIAKGMRVKVICDNDGGGGDDWAVEKTGTVRLPGDDGYAEVEMDGYGSSTFQFGAHQLRKLDEDEEADSLSFALPETATAIESVIALTGGIVRGVVIKKLLNNVVISEPDRAEIYLDSEEMLRALAKQAVEVFCRRRLFINCIVKSL